MILLRDLRREPATRDIPVIASPDLQEKPCEPEALYRGIKRAIGRARG